MKQFDEVCGFPAVDLSKSGARPTKTMEAMLDKYYDRYTRVSRRVYGKSAVEWYAQQVDAAMPWLYHCGGVK